MPGACLEQLSADFERLGVPEGAVVLVHASLRRIRPDGGGAATVAAALLGVLGGAGTIVVPAQTTWNSTSSPSYRAATSGLAASEIAAYRRGISAFDPRTTPSWLMGAFAEHVRCMPGATRSSHPQSSFAAVGALASEVTALHPPECHLGERSPLGALYDKDGWVLHLGTDFRVATIFHLAEYRQPAASRRRYEAKVTHPSGVDGWIAFDDIELDDGDFAQLGADFEERCGTVRRGPAGSTEAIFYPARAAADYAVEWMRRERAGSARTLSG